jgi:hypothetical protein
MSEEKVTIAGRLKLTESVNEDGRNVIHIDALEGVTQEDFLKTPITDEETSLIFDALDRGVQITTYGQTLRDVNDNE